MITVSTCLIVKNEELVLARCLDSLTLVSDEIIIVDTGSVDRTKEIAAKYTDKIFDFPWTYDFSAARNFSLSKASKDYIYVADADEVLDKENQRKFLSLKQNILPEIEIVQMYYTNQLEFNTTYNFDKELRPKLYKRLREFYFIEPIHEAIRLEPIIYNSDIEICHKPHESHAERDLKIFRMVVKEQGRLSKRLRTMYAKELFIAGKDSDFLMAKEYFESLIEDTSLTEDEIKQCQCVLAKCAALNHDTEGFFKNCLKNIATSKASSEICYELGEHYRLRGEYEEASMWYYNAAFETEPELDIRYRELFPIENLITCHEIMGNEKEAERFRNELLLVR